ncbi:MAG: 4a-hydroxytetrahydrobiopterin dehydratase [Gammaproteobacteria bacterium]|nr:4a-hydroxytetrahydrobiopterin dehydratase [Gammaproteobacteria bacterium]
MTEPLNERHCIRVEKGSASLATDSARALLAQLHADWAFEAGDAAIRREFRFHNFHETMAFVNALAWIAHREDHHPDLDVGYNRCTVHYSTHAAAGLTENDFICAAKIDALLTQAD